MKIALVRSAVHRHGGVERYVWLLARELAGRGHEVHLLARRCPELPHPSVRLRPIAARGFFSFQKVLSFARGVRDILERESFDIVHSCDRVHSCDIYRAGEGVHREWLEVAARHLPTWRVLLRRLDPLHAALCRIERRLMAEGGARRVTAISRRGAEEIGRHFGRRDVPVIYNGVDPEEFTPPTEGAREAIRRRLEVAADAFVVLHVGSGFFRKGLRYLLMGFGRLEEQNSILLVAGRGAAGPYRRLAGRLGVMERVRFVGMEIPTPQLYRAADVFVFATLYEPFGNVCLEALASGLPCVFSSQSGGAEVITDEVDGLVLKDPTDPEEIARLIRLCRAPGRAAAMGRAARALALRFPVGANADATEALYREVAAEKAEGR
ncbi:MAG: glycosyltransferase family 4 protein [Candidatus Tectomicrobia bacterium]|nr:glycosyltransferase family 4 protein [Candidatus Tectomicrobia bacterium]